MPQRRYGELCPIARSADLLGERWTVLVLRELLLGPQRFSELLDRLPTMGANRLSQRLSTLSEAGVIARTGGERTAGYVLTAWGEGLRPVFFELVRWGFPLLLQREDGDTARAEIITLGLTALADPPDSLTGVYDFRIDDERFHVTVDGGGYRASSGSADGLVDATVTGTIGGFLQTITGAGDALSIDAKPEVAADVQRLLHAPATRAQSIAADGVE